MDETEITNNEYRQFVYWVQDSLFRNKLAETNPDKYFYPLPEGEEDESMRGLNWEEKMDEEDVDIEKTQVKILHDVKAAVKIPVSVKLSPFYTNPLKIISSLDKAKADGRNCLRFFDPTMQAEVNTRAALLADLKARGLEHGARPPPADDTGFAATHRQGRTGKV